MRDHITKRLTARLAVPVLMAAALLSASPAQAEFRGGGLIHSYVGCEAYGWQDSDMTPVRARYGPSEVFGDPSTVSLFGAWGGALHFYANTTFDPGRTRYRGRGVGIYRSFWIWEERPRIRISQRRVVLPRDETFANALVVDLRIRVVHFAGLQGCAATVDLTLHRQD